MENSGGKTEKPVGWRAQARRKALVVTWTILGGVIVFTVLLYGCQRKLIYFPRGYEPSYRFGFPEGTIALEHETRGGAQESYYVPPATGARPPATLWVMFGGNGARALDWLDLVERCLPDDAGALLIDYPGYGVSKGKPTRETISEAADSAFQALAREMEVEPGELETDLRGLGHSLGAAVTLEFAVKHPMRQIILVSPFTSLLDMAKRTVGWPLNQLVVDRFDNRARLKEIAERNPRPKVDIFHGTADQIIPRRMGKELAGAHPKWIEFHSIQNGDHNWVLEIIQADLEKRMATRIDD